MHYIKPDVLTQPDMSIDGLIKKNHLQKIKTIAEVDAI